MDNNTKLNEALSYYLVLLDNETGRERSWNKCYEVFSEARNNRPIDDSYMDYLCLHLAWFLASWGMLRNSFLMGYNHTIHKTAIEKILDEKYDVLHGISCEAFNDDDNKARFNKLVDEVRASYEGNSPSDTLISKILLGTMGCTPASDTYFDKALKECGITPRSFKSKTIEQFGQIINALSCNELDKLKEQYPEMKIVDMAMWQRGYNIDLEEKAKKAANE